MRLVAPALLLSLSLCPGSSVQGEVCIGSPLAVAAASGDTKALAYLLSSAKTTCDPVSQALFCALDSCKLTSVMSLLENQRAVKCLKEDFTSPLDLAIIKAASMSDEHMASTAFTLLIKLARSERIALSWLAKCKAILCASKRGYDSIAHYTEIHKESVESMFFPVDLQEALEEASSVPGDKMFKTIAYIMKSEPLVSPAANKHRAFYNACRSGSSELVRFFLGDDRVDPLLNDGFALLLAVDSGSVETVLVLLEDTRVDPSARNNQSFIMAVEKGNLEIARLLAEDIRVDTAARKSKALTIAVENEDTHLLVYLLEETNADPKSGQLIRASLDKKPIILEILLYDGRAQPTFHDLLYCVSSKRYHLVRLLLKDGRVDPNGLDGAAIQMIGKMGLQAMFWDFLYDPRIDITACNGGILRETLEDADSFGHKVILLTLLHDKRFARFIASRTWIENLKGPIWPVAEHLLWFAHHFWKLRRDGKEPKVPEAYKPPCEIPNVRVLSLWLNKISSAYESTDREETTEVLAKYVKTWENGVTEEFREPDEFILSGGKGKETEKQKGSREASYSSETGSSGSPRKKTGHDASSRSAGTPRTATTSLTSTPRSTSSSTTSSFSIPGPPKSRSSNSSSSTNGTPRAPKFATKISSGDFMVSSKSRTDMGRK